MLHIKTIANSKNVEDGKINVNGYDDTMKAKFHLRPLEHPDLFDCIMPINCYDMDYSLLVNHFTIKRRHENKCLNLKLYIPVSK